MKLDEDDPLRRFDALTAGQENDVSRRLARAHLLATREDSRITIRKSIVPLLEEESPLVRRHALGALSLVCNEQEIQELAENCHFAKYLTLRDLWQGERMVGYYACKIEEQDLIDGAGNHGYTLGNAYFTIATACLARGDRQKAYENFNWVLTHGGPLTFDYALAKGYITRMTHDPSWPPSDPQSH